MCHIFPESQYHYQFSPFAQCLLPDSHMTVKHLRLGTALIWQSVSALVMMVCIWLLKKRAFSGRSAPGCERMASTVRLSCVPCKGRKGVGGSGAEARSTSARPAAPKASYLGAVDFAVREILRELKVALGVADEQLPNLLATLIQQRTRAEVDLPHA